ncbi:PhnE/PtxC family ABC transporter permease [Secundilactobacillus kimchicus]|uniref:PhnE/PtxC family ABC transporter permease n=1 Tax=Secundilactobacillus kimchicus TaxID=528209 RepID=UPI0006D18EE1|nr:ABC transporter permease subunit [Secundilactobacillus kimchicus]MBT9672141.1 ABC transporter permease subunit [Secundilactobacillus kimchicus]
MIEQSNKPVSLRPTVAASLHRRTGIHDRRKITISLLLTSLLILTGYTLTTLAPAHFRWGAAVASFVDNVRVMMISPSLGNDTWSQLMAAMGETVGLAILTTLIGAGGGFVMALLSADNLAPKAVASVVKAILAWIRAVPTILWVLIYSVSLGLGPNAAVIGISFHSVAYLGKVYANSLEAIPAASIEALKASGAGLFPILCQAVLPVAAARLLSWTFIRFEINFADAVVVGAAAGAGGIGYQLFTASNFYFDFHEVGLLIYLILGFAIIAELVAVKLRAKFMD